VEKHTRLSGGSRSATVFRPQDVASESTHDRRFENQLAVYYARLARTLRDASQLFIFGPGEAKRELKKALEKQKGLRMTIIEACIANERRATNGSPDPRAFTSELPNISCAGIDRSSKYTLGWCHARSVFGLVVNGWPPWSKSALGRIHFATSFWPAPEIGANRHAAWVV
jgi:hypothetical protein